MSSQTPYIGSKISLISKLDIRYEGVLYAVNTSDSTIALIKVRSFGTEERVTANPVAARDDVYEHIIFKASDIKDLIVCETPKPQGIGGLPYDPAIVSVSNRPETAPSAGSSRSNTPNRISPGMFPPGSAMNRAPGAGRGALQNRNPPQQQPQQPVHLQFRQGNQRGSRQGGYPQQQGGYQQGGYNNRNNYGGVPPLLGRGMGSMRAGFARHQNQPRDKVHYESDYDFEKANEQFQETLSGLLKDKLMISEKTSPAAGDSESGEVTPKTEVKEDENTADEQFYNKSSSFFDRISCEALEKAEGKKSRPDWRKERETNQETFGHQAVRSLNYRRGFGRGMGGNRGGGGGQRYNGYNNGYRNYGGNYGGGQGNYGGGRGGGFRRQNNNQQPQAAAQH